MCVEEQDDRNLWNESHYLVILMQLVIPSTITLFPPILSTPSHDSSHCLTEIGTFFPFQFGHEPLPQKKSISRTRVCVSKKQL